MEIIVVVVRSICVVIAGSHHLSSPFHIWWVVEWTTSEGALCFCLYWNWDPRMTIYVLFFSGNLFLVRFCTSWKTICHNPPHMKNMVLKSENAHQMWLLLFVWLLLFFLSRTWCANFYWLFFGNRKLSLYTCFGFGWWSQTKWYMHIWKYIL